MIDALIPFVIGLLMVIFPQLMFKREGTEEQIAQKKARSRTIGFVLICVAGLYFVIGLTKR